MDNKLQIQIVQNLVPVLTADVTVGGGKNITFGDTMTGTGTSADPINVSNAVLQQISDNAEQSAENASQISDIQNTLSNVQDDIQNATEQISDIQSVIPATANPENQLADQGFVNSSIQTATAYFRGDWATWADVPSDPSLYPADATGNHTPITNDYMVVIADEQENGGTWRYKYTGLWSEQGKDGWQPEYQVNETPLTAAQLAALNSGITAEDVASFVKNTDYPTVSNAGVIKVSTTYGITTYDGSLIGTRRDLEQYLAADELSFVSKYVLENIKDNYVKRGITANTIALTDEEKTAAQAWLGIDSAGGGDYLPLSGGTLTGSIAFKVSKNTYFPIVTQEGNGLGIFDGYTNSQKLGFSFSLRGNRGLFHSYTSGLPTIGDSQHRWGTVFVQELNNGADIAIPTTGGTLARIEDIDERIGDISTALTAILGE